MNDKEFIDNLLAAATLHGVKLQILDAEEGRQLRIALAEKYNPFVFKDVDDPARWEKLYKLRNADVKTIYPYGKLHRVMHTRQLIENLAEIVQRQQILITFDTFPYVFQMSTFNKFSDFRSSADFLDFYLFDHEMTFTILCRSENSHSKISGKANAWANRFNDAQFADRVLEAGTKTKVDIKTLNSEQSHHLRIELARQYFPLFLKSKEPARWRWLFPE